MSEHGLVVEQLTRTAQVSPRLSHYHIIELIPAVLLLFADAPLLWHLKFHLPYFLRDMMLLKHIDKK